MGAPVIRGILFDKDGTLLDYEATWGPLNRQAALTAARGDTALAARLLVHAGYDDGLTRAQAGTPIAAGTTAEIAELFASLLPGTDVAVLTAEVVAIFDASASHAVVVPGAKATLQALARRGLALGVATHDSIAGLCNSLQPHGLLELLQFQAGYDSGYGHKPGPGMLNAFCHATRLNPAEVCVVGDNRHDLAMGVSGGAGYRIGVLTGTSTTEDLQPYADLVLPDITSMLTAPPFLAALNER
jgi:phosphoglycolate phosphatase